jgi:putative flippase GtrA
LNTPTTPTAVPLARRLAQHKLAKFIVVGVANNLVGYGAFVVLSLLGVAAIPAMTVAYVIGMVISFTGNRKWTFGHRGSLVPTLVKFAVANLLGYGVNFALLRLFVSQLGLPQIPVQFFATGCVALCTFLMMRLWVFRADRGDAVE